MSDITDVTAGQAFQFAVEKELRKKQVTFEYLENANEHLRVEVIDDLPYIVANQAGMLALAKLLITIGAGCNWEGFHLHLRQDFNGDREEVLRIRLEGATESETKAAAA
jgi:hypothetical protein